LKNVGQFALISQKMSFDSLLSSSLDIRTLKELTLHQPSLRTIYDILSQINTIFNCWYYSVVYKYHIPNWWFSFLLPALTVHLLFHLTFRTTTKCNLYLDNSLAAV